MVTTQGLDVAPVVHPRRQAAHAVQADWSLRRVLSALVRTAVIVGLYELYAWARDRHGAATAGALEVAQRHAGDVARLQSALHLPDERGVQEAVLPHEWFIRLMGGFYGTAHFVVTLGVLTVLLLRRPQRLVREGSVLAVATFVAVGVFALYPVAPPRLMPPPLRTVDTLETVGGVWSYDHGVLEHISDPYAAMPSLHLGWATWCAVVAWRTGRTRWRVLGAAHVVATAVVVVVTGTHFYLDAVAGTLLVLAVAGAQSALLSRSAARSSTAAA